MTATLIKSRDVQDIPLHGVDDAKLGAVREMFVQLETGRVAFLVTEVGSWLPSSGKFHPVPWAAVRYDGSANVFRIGLTKAEFKAAPGYDREQLASPDYGWDEQAVRYFADFSSATGDGHV